MTDPIVPFGGDDRYYSAKPKDASPRDAHLSSTERDIKSALVAAYPDLEQRITRTFRQWNAIIRDQLRNEMGLRLSVGDEHLSIPVTIVPGLAGPLHDALQGMPPLYWKLLVNKGLLESAKSAISFLNKECPDISRLVTLQGIANPCVHVDISARYLEAILAHLAKLDQLRKALTIDHDVLGAYFFYHSKIELYWMAIGLVSGGLGLLPEALTIVVATHELAHAYSHYGKDIDGVDWKTHHFANADIHVVEGIAQYYTRAVCSLLDRRVPGLLRTFETLLACQPTPYTDFAKWNIPPRAAGEVVRLSMIACRSSGVTSYKDFLGIIMRYENLKEGPNKESEKK